MIEWYRVCFDPRPSRKRFSNGREFEEWLSAHISIEHRPAGFIILSWGTSPNTMGTSLWNIIIPTKDQSGKEIDVVGYFADNNWVIDDYDVVVMEKHFGGEERVIPPMRNLQKYPVTRAEQIATLSAAIQDYKVKEADQVGSMTVVVLETILQDLYRITAREEDITHVC